MLGLGCYNCLDDNGLVRREDDWGVGIISEICMNICLMLDRKQVL